MNKITIVDIAKSVSEPKITQEKIIPVEDQVLPTTFSLLRAIGFWTPSNIKWPLNIFYEMYKILCVSSLVSLFLTVLMDNIISEEKRWRDFFENLYMLQDIANSLCKVFNILVRRSKAEKLLKRFTESRWSQLRDNKEIAIIKESKCKERRLILFYFSLMMFHDLCNGLRPLFIDNQNKDLAVPAYTPCNRFNPICYWTCYMYQNFGYCICSFVHVACDGMIFNFIGRICAHLDILEHRLLQLPNIVESGADQEREVEYFKERMEEHQSILETVTDLNNIFNEVVAAQFFTSITILCTVIFLLSNQQLFSSDFFFGMSYLSCIFAQNYFYFWYGYKVAFNSLRMSRAIANMDWYVLHPKTKKMLLYTILNTSDKIQLFTNATVSLTPETFVKVLKISYSAFNILNQTKKA